MLAISPQRDINGDGREEEVGCCLASTGEFCDKFMGGDFLDDINFDDLFTGLDDDEDMLPELEVDPEEILAAFSVDEESATAAAVVGASGGGGQENGLLVDETGLGQGEKVLSAREKTDEVVATTPANSSSSEADRGRKPSAKSSQGKRKVKVDWTPELHRRFVQAVEQLGIDKAVPSKILELMGVDCLTRHNVASHLQKYRSHRKHLLVREAEAASWRQRWQTYAGGGGGGEGAKRDMNPWLLPTFGFAPPPVQPFRSLHVWGHPTVDHPLVHVWPKHLVPARSPPSRPWASQPPLPPPPPTNPLYLHTHYPRGPREGWVSNALTQGTPCFPQPLLTAGFPAPPVPGVPPHPLLHRPENLVPQSSKLSSSQLLLDASPSEESIDAAIGDVLLKPWLPLPLGLKPPPSEGVLVELQRQGISKIPPVRC